MTATVLMWPASSFAARPLEVSDYFAVQRIADLALSSDGLWVTYATERRSLVTNHIERTVYVQSLSSAGAVLKPEPLSAARAIAWRPGTHEIAFLSDQSDVTQLFTYDVKTQRVRQITQSPESLVSFRFAPAGDIVAFATRTAAPPRSSLYSRLQDGDEGILIDPDTAGVRDFLKPNSEPLPTALWVMRPDTQPIRVPVAGETTEYWWSPAGDALSLTFVSDDVAPSLLKSFQTSLGIYSVGGSKVQVIAAGTPSSATRFGTAFLGGEWIPRTHKVLVRRVTERDPWVSRRYPEWTIHDVREPWNEASKAWHKVPTYAGAVFEPVDASRILVENTVHGQRTLFELSSRGIAPAKRVSGMSGSSTMFRFDTEYSRVVFVNEEFTHPPEVFMQDGGAVPRKLTGLNDWVAQLALPKGRSVQWASADGTSISGWLLEPIRSDQKRPWPLITFVHGGPSFVITNAFAPYWRAWPYPLEAYATHGIAVFLPNYRGTQGLGEEFATPSALDQEPVQDIITGVESLIEQGIADPSRLGISGHSHGAWLAPLVMTRMKTFKAGSFAEGWSNIATLYALTSGQHNREIHDVVFGGSLYDSPQRYLEMSPDLHMRGVTTATLFEAGAQEHNAVNMLNYPKAARAAGLPTEFIVYPQTGHNMQNPKREAESARRNLEWFMFWLNAEEPDNANKDSQYSRWRAMKEQLEARIHGERLVLPATVRSSKSQRPQ